MISSSTLRKSSSNTKPNSSSNVIATLRKAVLGQYSQGWLGFKCIWTNTIFSWSDLLIKQKMISITLQIDQKSKRIHLCLYQWLSLLYLIQTLLQPKVGWYNNNKNTKNLVKDRKLNKWNIENNGNEHLKRKQFAMEFTCLWYQNLQTQ